MSKSLSLPPREVVLLNARARGGSGAERWERVAPVALEGCSVIVIPLDADGGWERALHGALAVGVRTFVAAGGDGTVSALVDALVRAPSRPPLAELTLGAVGLGSSNDYHKPAPRLVAGVPLRMARVPNQRRDVCRARFRDAAGELRERCFVVSASVGATAEGNARFNRRTGLLAWLAQRSTGLGIAVAALLTVLTHRPLRLCLTIDGEELTLPVASLNAQKTPYLSGALRFDTPAAAADGHLGVNICSATTRRGLAWALLDLARGRFMGPPDRHFWRARTLRFRSELPLALELDGEIVTTTEAELTVLVDQIGVFA